MKKVFSFLITASLSVSAMAWNMGAESFPVTDYGTIRPENLHTSAVAGGNTFVVWTMQEQGEDGSHSNLYLQVLDAEGNTKLGPTGKRINTVDGPSYVSAGISVVATSENTGLVIAGDSRETAESFYTLPYVYAVDNEGNVTGKADGELVAPETASANKYALYALGNDFYATYDANEPGTYNAYTYVTKVSADGKALWDAPVKLFAGNCSLAASGDGFIAVGTNSNRLLANKYTAEGQPAWDAEKEIYPKTSMWGAVPIYTDREGGVYVPYEYTDAEWNTHNSLAHVAADGTVNAELLASLSPVDGMTVNKSSLHTFKNGKFLVLTSLRKGYTGNYFLNGAVYGADGKMVGEAVTLDEAPIGFSFVGNLDRSDNSAVVLYVHPESYDKESLVAMSVNDEGLKNWTDTIVPGPGVSQYSVVAGKGSYTTYFVEAPTTESVGVRGLHCSINGGFSPEELKVTLTEAGTLASLLPEDMSEIKLMTIAGPINGTDVNAIRKVALHIEPLVGEMGSVERFDFKNASIVAGGEPYYKYYDWDVYDNVDVTTEDDVFPAFIFYSYSVDSIVFPDNIKAVGRAALYDCAKLAEINLPESVDSIGYEAFAGTAITSIKLPENLKSIGAYALYSTNLSELTLPEKITVIPEGLVQATFINGMDLGGRITEIGLNAFKDCAYLTGLKGYENVEKIKNYAFYNCIGLTDAPISEKVTSIGTEAFLNCSSIEKVELPASLTYLGRRAFVNCGKLKEINVADGNNDYASANGMLYTKDMTSLITCPAGHADNVEVAEGTTSLGISAFEACAKMTHVTLPATLTNVDNEAFKFCVSLSDLVCNAVVPPTVGWSDPFLGVPVETCTLTVPSLAAVEAYKAADGWKNFLNITTTETGISKVGATVNGACEWYNMNGVRLNAKPSVPGIYLRKQAGAKAERVLVK